jgi:hypothetical protein
VKQVLVGASHGITLLKPSYSFYTTVARALNRRLLHRERKCPTHVQLGDKELATVRNA